MVEKNITSSFAISFSSREVKDLIKGYLAISLAFAILFRSIGLLEAFVVSLFTVGVGFLLHELAHKFVAQYYLCHAEFRSDDKMLILAIVVSFFGFVFAAPGAVHILGVRNKRHYGHIAVAGPIVNLVLCVLFLLVPGVVGDFGFRINAMLALFNMIPFGPLDGAKVISWDKTVFWIVLGLSGLFFVVGMF